MRTGFALLAGSCLMSLTSYGALAAETGGTVITTQESFRTVLVFNPATVTTNNINTFTTQIIGQIVGGSIVFDQTFGLPYADPTVQAGQTAAIAAITTAGGPGVVIGAPVLTSSSTTNSSSSASVYSLASSVFTPITIVTFGPDVISIGALTSCTGLSSLPGPTAPTCTNTAGDSRTLVVGELNFNVIIETVATIDQTTTVTNTTNLFEQYTISGSVVVQAIGGEHAAAVSAIGDENQRFSQVLLSNIVAGGAGASDVAAFAIPGSGGPAMGWAEGFGWTGHGASDKRSGAGLEGGLAVNVSEQVKLGFGVSHGWVDTSLNNGTGSADAELTELGLAASWADNGLYLGVVGIAGFGSVDTTGLASSASYDTTLFSAAGEAGYHIGMDGFTLTPHVGGQWLHISTDNFTGAGAPALTSQGSSNSFGKGWLGLKATGQSDGLALSGYARLVAYADENISLPVSFVGSPTILAITGAERDTLGVEVGLSAGLTLTDNLDASLGYDIRLRDGQATHMGVLSLVARW